MFTTTWATYGETGIYIKMAVFEMQKEKRLSQPDLSKKGSIDEHILELVQYINGLDNYFTTSSCSGRICVFSEDSEQKKKSGKWLFVSHGKIELQSLLLSLDIMEGNAIFKFEPFVLHVQCKKLEDAKSLLRIALESGYKNSGIVVGKKSRFILAVRSTQSMEVPVISNGKLLVSNEYIEYLVEIANNKMEENLRKIERFFKNLRTLKERETVERSSQKGNRKQNSLPTSEKSDPQTTDFGTKECEHIGQHHDKEDFLTDFYENHAS